ncbi:MAG: MFS transporter [Deltaproteobacteria bacterium]|nr:MFS transporter [Deltaproteobacteria bacterium]
MTQSKSSAAGNAAGIITTKMTLVALTAADAVGVVMLYVIPLIIGSISDAFGVQEGTSGLVSSLEFGTMAIAGLVLSPVFQKLKVKQLAIVGITVLFLGNLVSALCAIRGAWVVFVISRGVVGLAEGTLYALAYGMAAKTRDPNRTYSIYVGFEVTFAMLMMILIGIFVEKLGPAGSFVTLGGISLIMIPIFLWFPKNDEAPVETKAKVDQKFSRDVYMLIIGMGLFCIGLNTLYPFVERIGVLLEIATSRISMILTLSLFCSIFGALICGVLGTRYGRTVPLIIGVVFQVAAIFMLVYTQSTVWFSMGAIVQAMAIAYFLPLFNGLVAFFDRSGRATCAAAGVIAVGTALGPFLAGVVLNVGGGYITLGWISAGLYMAMVVMGVKPALKADRTSDTDTPVMASIPECTV